MEIQNTALKNQIDKWLSINPVYNKIFENFIGFIQIADCNSAFYQLSEKELTEFIDGLIYIGLSFCYKEKDNKKEQHYSEEGIKLLKPVLDAIIKQAQSESYREYVVKQQITEKNAFEFGGVYGLIDNDAIKLHANRIGKLIITRKDVEEIEKDFINYTRKLYSESKSDNLNQEIKLSTKLNQPRMKAIHQYLYEEMYIELDEASWLYWFDLQPWLSKKKKPSRIKWKKASSVLSNVIYILCGNMGVKTETAMKSTFVLPKGTNFQKMTITKKKPQSDKEPYKSIHNMIEFAERYIKDLQ